MDMSFKNMDFLTTQWQPYRRRFPAPFQVIMFEFLRGKEHWIRHTFDSCNFSLILRGRGEFHRGKKVWRVQAPCVITQWPGEFVEYGPSFPGETWDELFFIYNGKLMSDFRRAGLVKLGRPIWPIANITGVEAQIEELRRLSRSDSPERFVDRVDRVAERLILETLLAPAAGADEKLLSDRAAAWRQHLAHPIDFSEEAMICGMSISTFRRRWQRFCSQPPAQYLLHLRIHEACRLLVESEKPIREIAGLTGFDDEFYFSRRFRIRVGVPPSEYRRLYHVQRFAPFFGGQ